jgi:hypothetical protein
MSGILSIERKDRSTIWFVNGPCEEGRVVERIRSGGYWGAIYYAENGVILYIY